MSKVKNVIGSLVTVILVFTSVSTLADDFQEVLKKDKYSDDIKSISSSNINTLDVWSMHGKVKQYQDEIEAKNRTRKQAIAVMEKDDLNTWRKNLGNPVKL